MNKQNLLLQKNITSQSNNFSTHRAKHFFEFIRWVIAAFIFFMCVWTASAQPFGLLTNLVSFNGTNGHQPSGPLIQGKDGSLYGTCLYGGTNGSNAGVVFRITTNGSISNLVSFSLTNGSNPNGGVIQGSDSNLYGTTTYGGAFIKNDPAHNGFGSIFEIATNGGTLKLLSSFNSTNGQNPNSLTELTPGTFLGSANAGGAFSNFAGFGFGTVFKANTNSSLTNILSFNDANGASPSIGLVMFSSNILFGATGSGGPFEYGTIFRSDTNGSIKLQFNFNLTNGAVPSCLILGSDSNLYGTTLFGGSNQFGTIFKMTTNLDMTILFSFNGSNGDAPTCLTQGKDGNFYGMTAQGGVNGFGNIFELTTNGDLFPLYSFTGGADGFSGVSLIQGKDGNFYGTTSFGGTNGIGNLFRISVHPLPTIRSLVQSNKNITITWDAVPGSNYNVFFATNVNATVWTKSKTVTATATTGTNTDANVTDKVRFYRVAFPVNP
jgi:uncharacterized repeat protein (TIGR03803 family)